jgi:hypothetical protein
MLLSLVTVSAAAPELPDSLRDYRSWTLATPDPIPVPLALWVLCRKPDRQEIEAAERAHGEHAHHAIRVFVNELAASHFSDMAAALPAGSIVVKEKLEGADADVVAAVAAMIKHGPGFSPSTGDWEFVYVGKHGERTAGPALQAHCGSCHASSRSTDWLFRSYLSRGNIAREAGRR